MKNFKAYSLVVALGFIIIFSSCSKNDNITEDVNSSGAILKSGNRPSANGQGTFFFNDNERHFSFHVNTMPNGSVTGSGVLNYNGSGNVQIKFDINCLTVIGSTATMSGTVTSSNLVSWTVGAPCVFRVVDNGEGSSNPDEITLLYQTSVWDCTTLPEEILLFQIEGGNIQVKP